MDNNHQPQYTYNTGPPPPIPSPAYNAQASYQLPNAQASYQLPNPGEMSYQQQPPFPGNVFADQYPDEKGKTVSGASTAIQSAASSILDGKAGFNEEKGEHGHGHDHIDINDPNRPKFGLRQRLHHFTWAWYTLSMSTGGLSLLIFAQPFQFPGLRQIGLFVYIANIIIFTGICSMMLARFFLHKGDFGASLTHPREGFFFPTFWLSCATLITSTQRYAIPENDSALTWAIQTAFWVYVIGTLMLAVGQYTFVFAAHSYALGSMMPTWILPIFPIMLSGTIASVIAETQPEIAAVPIIVAGMSCQGLGMMVALMMFAHMTGRLMAAGLPNREHRTGLYMCVGPPSFTALALIGMANGLPDSFDHKFDGVLDATMLRTIAVVSAVFLWGLSLWWWGIATISVIASPPVYFHLGWWAMVFPNTGFVLATISLSNEFQNTVVKGVATGMSVMLLITYIYVFVNHVKAIMSQDIMYPGRDEDVEDH